MAGVTVAPSRGNATCSPPKPPPSPTCSISRHSTRRARRLSRNANPGFRDAEGRRSRRGRCPRPAGAKGPRPRDGLQRLRLCWGRGAKPPSLDPAGRGPRRPRDTCLSCIAAIAFLLDLLLLFDKLPLAPVSARPLIAGARGSVSHPRGRLVPCRIFRRTGHLFRASSPASQKPKVKIKTIRFP